MARFYADENFPLPVLQVLRGLGHDVLTIGEAGKVNQQYSDAAVLQDAANLGRCVLAPTILTTRARRSVLTKLSAVSLC